MQFVIFKNINRYQAAHFVWEGLNDLVKVWPITGKLAPEKSQLVTIEFTAGSEHGPAFHNIELSCHVTSESDQVSYQAQFESWTKEKKRQEEEFVFTDSKFPPSQRKGQNKKKINFKKYI